MTTIRFGVYLVETTHHDGQTVGQMLDEIGRKWGAPVPSVISVDVGRNYKIKRNDKVRVRRPD
jgi:hypothetical protein